MSEREQKTRGKENITQKPGGALGSFQKAINERKRRTEKRLGKIPAMTPIVRSQLTQSQVDYLNTLKASEGYLSETPGKQTRKERLETEGAIAKPFVAFKKTKEGIKTEITEDDIDGIQLRINDRLEHIKNYIDITSDPNVIERGIKLVDQLAKKIKKNKLQVEYGGPDAELDYGDQEKKTVKLAIDKTFRMKKGEFFEGEKAKHEMYNLINNLYMTIWEEMYIQCSNARHVLVEKPDKLDDMDSVCLPKILKQTRDYLVATLVGKDGLKDYLKNMKDNIAMFAKKKVKRTRKRSVKRKSKKRSMKKRSMKKRKSKKRSYKRKTAKRKTKKVKRKSKKKTVRRKRRSVRK